MESNGIIVWAYITQMPTRKLGQKKRKQSGRLVLVQRAACYRTSQKKHFAYYGCLYFYL